MIKVQPSPIPVIDLFAGAGGLGEGFSSPQPDGRQPFSVRLSVDADPSAHATLELRAFFRQFPAEAVPSQYYEHLRGEISREALFGAFPDEAAVARSEACLATLGGSRDVELEIDKRISAAVAGAPDWVLIGGPPCQAYSLVGRSRNQANPDYRPEEDHRHFLYREYLRIIRDHRPAVFLMENVKGVLSARVDGEPIFRKILQDLQDPNAAFGRASDRLGYRLYPLAHEARGFDLFGDSANSPGDYVVECERFGIPQRRHRVLILGVRHDLNASPRLLSPAVFCPDIEQALGDLPRVRAALSSKPQGGGRSTTTEKEWRAAMLQARKEPWLRAVAGESDSFRRTKKRIREVLSELQPPAAGRGAEWLSATADCMPRFEPAWFHDPRLGGVCNHTAREHMAADFHRYLWAACYAEMNGVSPRLRDFPEALRPMHQNVGRSLDHDNFSDRFTVQLRDKSSTTIMSHIAKDGHYYIHYDPTQCRSLTVREAARLQTFPDNFFFCGPRTDQYKQVGNAVPPLLARQVAAVIDELLARQRTDG